MNPSALSIDSLRFRYPGSAGWALRIDVLELAAGEQMLLTGGSGSGKSTLLHLICGLWEPDEGTIVVAGRDIHALRGAARDRFRGATIGMIFQTFNLLHGFTALENVAAALMFSVLPRGEHRGRAAALLDHLGVAEHGRDVDRLSIGQQQRVAVARAVAAKPAVVLADEPTASLDPASAERAMQLIQQTCSENGAALLCVSHDPAMERRFDRRAALSDLAAAAGAGAAP